MAISLASLQTSTALRPPRVLIHGVAGIGKFTFAASADGPVFVLTEDGLGKLQVPHFPLATSYAEVAEALDALLDEDHAYSTVVVDILEGPQQGRKVFDQLNLVNVNPTTVEIAQRTLSAICHATGKLQVNDSEELHLTPMTIQVGVKPPKDGYGERNTIRYMVPEAPAQATPPKPAATQPTNAPAQSAPARPATAPWNRKS